jgi:hypothetical protein
VNGSDGYGLRLRFNLGAVGLERWKDKEERLGRFFAKGLHATLTELDPEHIDLHLLQGAGPTTGQHGEQ